MKWSRPILGWLIALAVLGLRWTCRVRIHQDPRLALQRDDVPYIYGVLHAHQIAAVVFRERGTVAMVSRSADGQLLMPAFWLMGIKAIRGSSRKPTEDRGGRAALEAMVQTVQAGAPAYLAVDGPLGPRNRVKKGIAVLSRRARAAIVLVVLIPRRRWVFRKAWDRMQIPQPFTRIDAWFAEPLVPADGETAEGYRRRIDATLSALESEHDPAEATRTATVRLEQPAVT